MGNKGGWDLLKAAQFLWQESRNSNVLYLISFFQEGTDVHKDLEWSSRVLQRLVEEGLGWLAVFCPAGKGAETVLCCSFRAGPIALL